MILKVRWLSYILVSFFAMQANAHPMHITVSNVDITSDSIKTIVSLDYDDLIEAIGTPLPDSVDSGMPVPELVQLYVKKRFKVALDYYVLFQFQKIEFSDQKVLIYMDAYIMQKVKEITIENTLLQNLHGDPKNMVIVSKSNIEKGIEFNALVSKKTITLVD